MSSNAYYTAAKLLKMQLAVSLIRYIRLMRWWL